MSTSTPCTISPFSRRMTRRTPWVLGCWGPMLRMSSSVWGTMVSGVTWVIVSLSMGHGPGDGRDMAFYPLEPEPIPANGILFSEGVALPVVREEDPPEVGMALEINPHHVVGLSFEPVGRPPDVRHGRGRLRLPKADLQPKAPPSLQAIEVIDHLEGAIPVRVVDTAEVRQEIEMVLVFEVKTKWVDLVPPDDDGEFVLFSHEGGDLFHPFP